MLARGELRTTSDDGPASDASDAGPGAAAEPMGGNVAEAAAAFGLVIVPAERPAASAADAEPTFCLWPENEPAWQLWLAVQTQWRHAGMAGLRTGLDYAGVQVVIQRSGTRRRLWGRRFAELQVMERAALEVWHEQAEAERLKQR